MVIATVLLVYGTQHVIDHAQASANVFDLGFGTFTSETLIRIYESNSVAAMVLLAKRPQLILSFLYFTYNALFTSMRLTQEWNDYAYNRKPPRVTSHKGSQRSTYRLQLPYRYGIPLLAMAALLHWLVSQSIYLASLQAYSHTVERQTDGAIHSCGWSPAALFATIIIGVALLLLGIAMGKRRHRPGMPLARSCSAAISAACHIPLSKDRAAAVLKPLMWGDISGDDDKDSTGGIRHCSFTGSEDVRMPSINSLSNKEDASSTGKCHV